MTLTSILAITVLSFIVGQGYYELGGKMTNVVIPATIPSNMALVITYKAYHCGFHSLDVGGGGVLVFKIWARRGIMKNCSELEGLVKKGGSLRKVGFSKLFCQFSFGVLFSFFVCNQ